jgi:hypothetical protein
VSDAEDELAHLIDNEMNRVHGGHPNWTFGGCVAAARAILRARYVKPSLEALRAETHLHDRVRNALEHADRDWHAETGVQRADPLYLGHLAAAVAKEIGDQP